MAIQLEFINLIVPIQRIEAVYPSGWSGCLHDHSTSIGKIIWYDDHLFRTGAMDPEMMDNLIRKWTRLGFTATECVGGKRVWKDFCVVDSFGISRQGCSWLELDLASRTAWLRGAERGEVIGREHFR